MGKEMTGSAKQTWAKPKRKQAKIKVDSGLEDAEGATVKGHDGAFFVASVSLCVIF